MLNKFFEKLASTGRCKKTSDGWMISVGKKIFIFNPKGLKVEIVAHDGTFSVSSVKPLSAIEAACFVIDELKR